MAALEGDSGPGRDRVDRGGGVSVSVLLAVGGGAWLVALGLVLRRDRRRQTAALERAGNVLPLRQRSAQERRAAAELYPRQGLAEVAPIRRPSPLGQTPNLICSDPECGRMFYSAGAVWVLMAGDRCVCGARLRPVEPSDSSVAGGEST